MDTDLRSLQDIILRWIEGQGFVTWNEIKENCRGFVGFFNEGQRKLYGQYPEYRIFMPLLRNGCVEVAQSRDNSVGERRNGFRFVWNYVRDEIPDVEFDSLKVLKAIPSLRSLTKNFPRAESEVSAKALVSKCDIMKGYKYVNSDNGADKTGIYKVAAEPWYSEYLFEKSDSSIRRIPDFSTPFYESLNIARSYVRRQYFGSSFFEYDMDSKKLKIKDYSFHKNLANDFPILVMRSLVFLNKNQLKDSKYYGELGENIEYENVSLDVYNEMKRIFGE